MSLYSTGDYCRTDGGKENREGQSPTEVKDVKMITADLEYSY